MSQLNTFEINFIPRYGNNVKYADYVLKNKREEMSTYV